MSFEKKLYDYEVNPPQQVWTQISSALDDFHLEKSFKKKLETIKAEPPNSNWEKIEKYLNTEIADTVPAKLYNLTETPPPDLWSRIDERLVDDDFNKKLAEKLAAIEETPPVGNWRRIAANLKTEIPVVSIGKSYSRTVRYAAAAVVIGLIAWGGVTLFNNTKKTTIAESSTEKRELQNS